VFAWAQRAAPPAAPAQSGQPNQTAPQNQQGAQSGQPNQAAPQNQQGAQPGQPNQVAPQNPLGAQTGQPNQATPQNQQGGTPVPTTQAPTGTPNIIGSNGQAPATNANNTTSALTSPLNGLPGASGSPLQPTGAGQLGNSTNPFTFSSTNFPGGFSSGLTNQGTSPLQGLNNQFPSTNGAFQGLNNQFPGTNSSFQRSNGPFQGSVGFPGLAFPSQQGQFGSQSGQQGQFSNQSGQQGQFGMNQFGNNGTQPFNSNIPYGFSGSGFPYGGGAIGGGAIGGSTGGSQSSTGNGGYANLANSAAFSSVASAGQTPMGPASINISVPSSADVYVDGQKLNQGGATRQFITPALAQSQAQMFRIRAIWKQDGKDYYADEQVVVTPGDRKGVMILGGRPMKENASNR